MKVFDLIISIYVSLFYRRKKNINSIRVKRNYNWRLIDYLLCIFRHFLISYAPECQRRHRRKKNATINNALSCKNRYATLRFKEKTTTINTNEICNRNNAIYERKYSQKRYWKYLNKVTASFVCRSTIFRDRHFRVL